MKLAQYAIDEKVIAKFQKLKTGRVIVLELNENSDLLDTVKAPSFEFFKGMLGSEGLLWQIYSKTGLGAKPKRDYLYLLNNKLYFDITLEDQYMFHPGPIRQFKIKNQELVASFPWNLSNIIFRIIKPVEMLRQSMNVGLVTFILSKLVNEYPPEKKKALKFYKELSKEAAEMPTNRLISKAVTSLQLAIESMSLSLVASICSTYQVKIPKALHKICSELRSMRENKDRIHIDYPYHSLWPYDISRQRFSENDVSSPSYARMLEAIPAAPKDPYLVLRENSKFLASVYLAAMRKCYLELGARSGFENYIFYLSTKELSNAFGNNSKVTWNMAHMRSRTENNGKYAPSMIVISQGKAYIKARDQFVKGMSCAAKKVVRGRAVFIESESGFEKVQEGDVVFSHSLSPNLTAVYPKAAAIVSAGGGVLAHAALIARESNIVCIVKTSNIDFVKEGYYVTVDGRSGDVRVENK